MKKSWGYFVPFMFIIFFASSIPAQAQIVINEINADPAPDLSGDANGDGVRGTYEDEFVELINVSDSALDISQWSIWDADTVRHIFSVGTIIQPGRAIVVFGGGNPTGSFGGAVVQTASISRLYLNNTGDSVVIKNSLGTVIISYPYSNEANKDQSIGRNPDISGSFLQHSAIAGNDSALFSPGVSNVTGEPFLPEINIKGNGNSIADGDSSPQVNKNTDFGSAHIVTGTVEKVFVIENSGLALLGLSGTSPFVTISGDTSDFTVTQIPSQTISSGDSTTFRITFNPTETGTKNAVISIANDDSDENPYTFAVKGEGYKTIPQLSNIESSFLNYTEGEEAREITDSIAVSELYNLPSASAEIQITTNYIPGEDELTFTDQNGINGNWDSTIGKLTLSGSASLTDYQTAIRSVKYHNTSSNPSTLQRAVSFTVNDGTDNSNTLTRTINIVSVNDMPVLSNIERTTLHYTEGDSPLQITDSVEIDDPDNAFMRKAEIQITGNYQIGEDELIFTNQDGILGSWNAVAGKLTLNGTSSLTDYKTAIRSIKYRNSSDNPLTLQRIISFTVNDGTDNSNTLTRTINITSINNAPVLTNIETEPLIFTENDLPVQITNTITITDPDNTTMDSAAIQIVNNYQRDEDVLIFDNRDEIKGTWNNSSGMLTLKGSASASDYQSALRAVKYQNISEKPDTTPRTITFVVDDGEIPASLFITAKNKSNEKRVQKSSNFQQRIINVIAVNDPPELSGIEKTMLGLNEGDSAKIITDSLIVFDKDDIMLTKAEIWIAGGTYVKGEDELISDLGKWNAEKGKLTIDEEFPVEEFERSLRTIKYRNTNSFHKKVVEKAVRFKVYDHETGSNELMRIIRVNPENHSPELKNLESTVLKYDLLGGSKNITDSIEINDFDDENINSAGIQISVNYDSSSDSLLFDDFSCIRGVYYKELGRLSLLGKDSRVNYRNALRSVRFYVKNKKVPKSVHRTIQLIVSDGTSASKILQREIEIILPSEAPVVNDLPESIKLTNGDIYKINLWEYVEDKYTPDSLLIFQFIGNNNKISYNYNYSNGELEIKPVDNYVGNTELQIVVTNKYGSSIAVKFLIEITDDPLSAGGMKNGIPKEYVLYQNFPNPFNPLTKIVFGLPQESKVKIIIYNLLGEEIKILLNEVRSAGFHSIDFAASKLSSGVYFYRIEAKALSLSSTENFTSVRKMLVVK